jgi:hypothetical protein
MVNLTDIARCIEKSILAKVEAMINDKIHQFVNGFEQPEDGVEDVRIPTTQELLEQEDITENERTKWSDHDWERIAICYDKNIPEKIAHRLFPHLKERSIRCKYGEYRHIDTDGHSGLHGSESSREKARQTLLAIRQ